MKNAALVLATVLAALAVGLLWSRGRGPVNEAAAVEPPAALAPVADAPERDEVRRVHGGRSDAADGVSEQAASAPRVSGAAVRVQLLDPDHAPVEAGTCAFLPRPGTSAAPMPGREPAHVLATDGAGAADVTLAPGAWIIEPYAPGLVGKPVHLELADGDAREVVVEMEEAAPVCGRVTDRDTGAGIANAWVWCPTLGASLAVLTDADGRYRQPHLPAHTGFALQAVVDGYGAGTRYVTSPGRHDCAERPFDLELFGGKTIRGDLPASVDAARTRIEAIGSFPSGNSIRTWNEASARAELDGSFAIEDLRSDIEHELVVRSPGHARHVQVVSARQGLVDVGLVDLQREAILSGTVSGSDGARVADVVVRLARADPASSLDGADPFEVRTGPDGTYRLDGLPAGRWRIDVLGGGAPLIADEVDLVPGSTTRDLVLGETIPCVRGRVTSDEPDGLSLLVDIGTFARRIPIAADGTFTAHGVPYADSVLLHIQRADASGAWRDLSFVRGADLVPDEDVLIRLD